MAKMGRPTLGYDTAPIGIGFTPRLLKELTLRAKKEEMSLAQLVAKILKERLGESTTAEIPERWSRKIEQIQAILDNNQPRKRKSYKKEPNVKNMCFRLPIDIVKRLRGNAEAVGLPYSSYALKIIKDNERFDIPNHSNARKKCEQIQAILDAPLAELL